MKEKILELRKLGYSYSKIIKELGCSKSTISYHCSKNNIQNKNINNKIIDTMLNNIIKDRYELKLKLDEISKKYNISISTIKKYTSKKKITHENIICLNCGCTTKYHKGKKFCSSKCSSEYLHKKAYENFLKNDNNKYNNGGYIAKNFKDFILKEQNNICLICGQKPIWMNKDLVFVLDHIDGDASNNNRNNLRLICPNCDSQTNTFKSKTKNSKRRNYFREKIIKNINGGVAELG